MVGDTKKKRKEKEKNEKEKRKKKERRRRRRRKKEKKVTADNSVIQTPSPIYPTKETITIACAVLFKVCRSKNSSTTMATKN